MNPSLDAIFRPKSVAVVGASSQKGGLGREIFDKLLNSDFNGPIYPVNPKARFIHSVKAYPSIADIPDQVDLAILVVRKELVLPIIRACAQCGVKGVIVITAGFKETGAKGAELERQIVEIIRSYGMRMIGPNCMGVINTDPEVRLDATFAPSVPRRGNVGFVSQSGALGQTILEHTQALNLGVSMFVSVGNKADVSGNDLLEYWRDHPSVEVILMYLESFGNPRKFIQLAREVSLRKPIVVVKSGRTSSGARAASSHTGALAGMDMAFDALFKQCGVIRANTIEEMFDIALGLANLPLPKGNRLAIITNAGGPAIMAADACESLGLVVTKLGEKTKENLRARLVPEASVNNPVDLLAAGGPEEFQFALHEVLLDENVDSAIVIFVAPLITDPTQVAQKISQVAEKFDKPVMGCFMGVKGVATGVEELRRHRIPTYSFPESAARALASMVQ
ncbi:MAG: acetate--CoA ligase family protein, partial [bacterium]